MTERVVFLTRKDCHLCEEAKMVVDQVCAEFKVAWQMVDVDTVPTLKKQYGEMVPVVMVDGQQVGFWTIDADRLRVALS